VTGDGFNLGDYVPVAERIIEWHAIHDAPRVITTPPVVLTVLDKAFVVVTATVYVDHDEGTLPAAVASAWEPFPGKTPFTRDSEAMNAETSAVGRALALAGIKVNRSMASAEEVANLKTTGMARAEAKGLVLAAWGDRDAAVATWQRAFPDDPDTVDPAAIEVLCRLAPLYFELATGGAPKEPCPDCGHTDRHEWVEVPDSDANPGGADGFLCTHTGCDCWTEPKL
jgi:hypothetical protein